MNSNLKNAVQQFIGNEFQLEPDQIREDLNFETDLDMSTDDIVDILARLQDALDLPLPEEKFNQVHTVEDLYRMLGIETESDNLA